MSDDGAGTIVIVTGNLGRYTAWTRSVMQCQYPVIVASWSEGMNLAANLNRAIANGSGEWFWFMGDDHLFGPDLLLRMLAHQRDIVAPLCYLRVPPFAPIVYRSEHEDGSFELWPRDELPTRGLVPVAACSMAGMLIRRPVFEALTPPYFEVGQIKTDELGEDLYFCHKLGVAGMTPYLDCDTVISHITPMAVTPIRHADGTWGVEVDATCTIPASAAVRSLER